MNMIVEMLSYPFMVRALIAGVLLSFCASLLGVTLVLKRYAMIGDGLSHVGFGALALAVCLNVTPLAVALPIVMVAAVILLRLNENSKIKGDAAIALVSTGALAVGVILVSFSTGMNVDVYNYMFGSILAMSKEDVVVSVIMGIVVLLVYFFFYQKIFAVTFDENFAKATGIKTYYYQMLIAILTAVVIVLGMRLMGALLISSLIVFPAITAMRLCKQFKTLVICAVFVSVFSFLVGIVGSYLYATPTGASIVVVNMGMFVMFTLIKNVKNVKSISKFVKDTN